MAKDNKKDALKNVMKKHAKEEAAEGDTKFGNLKSFFKSKKG